MRCTHQPHQCTALDMAVTPRIIAGFSMTPCKCMCMRAPPCRCQPLQEGEGQPPTPHHLHTHRERPTPLCTCTRSYTCHMWQMNLSAHTGLSEYIANICPSNPLPACNQGQIPKALSCMDEAIDTQAPTSRSLRLPLGYTCHMYILPMLAYTHHFEHTCAITCQHTRAAVRHMPSHLPRWLLPVPPPLQAVCS